MLAAYKRDWLVKRECANKIAWFFPWAREENKRQSASCHQGAEQCQSHNCIDDGDGVLRPRSLAQWNLVLWGACTFDDKRIMMGLTFTHEVTGEIDASIHCDESDRPNWQRAIWKPRSHCNTQQWLCKINRIFRHILNPSTKNWKIMK